MINHKSAAILPPIVSSVCYRQNEKPSYQSNPFLNFSNFLSGITSVYVIADDKNVQYINANQNSGNSLVISELFRYLKTFAAGNSYRLKHIATSLSIMKIYCKEEKENIHLLTLYPALGIGFIL